MNQSFDTAAQPMANKTKPVPELASYGLILVALCAIVIILKRRK